MSDLFRKINVLVQSSIHELLGGDGRATRPALRPDRLGSDADREIASLRQNVNNAIDYEDRLTAAVAALQSEIAALDQQTDHEVAEGREDAARVLIDRMKQAQQRLDMAQADLDAHRRVTQDLIQRVNELEAAVADARRSEPAAEETPGAAGQTGEKLLSDVLREMREKIGQMSDIIRSQEEVTPAASQPQVEKPEGQSVEDDLARRRDRLSKKS